MDLCALGNATLFPYNHVGPNYVSLCTTPCMTATYRGHYGIPSLWCSPEIGGRVEGVSSYFCLFLNTYAASTLS